MVSMFVLLRPSTSFFPTETKCKLILSVISCLSTISLQSYKTLSTHVDFVLWPIARFKNLPSNFQIILIILYFLLIIIMFYNLLFASPGQKRTRG